MRPLALVLAVVAGVTFYAQESPCRAFCLGNSCFNSSACGAGCYCAKTKSNVQGIFASISDAQR